MSTQQAVPLIIQLAADDDDEEQLDVTARSLRAELVELPAVHEARLATARDAGIERNLDGTRTAELITLGALALAVLPAAVPEVIGFLKEWLLRPGHRPLKIRVPGLEVEYDPRDMTPDEVTSLVAQLQAAASPPAGTLDQP